MTSGPKLAPGSSMLAVGLMSGTSLDGIDAAVVETDGKDGIRTLGAKTVPYAPAMQERLRAVLGSEARSAAIEALERDLTLDHARIVDALLTGEGIAFAIQSGRYAAQAIVEAARTHVPERALDLYDAGYRSITRAFRDVRLLRGLVFSRFTRRAFLRALEGNERLVRSHMDVLAADTEYRDYARLVLAQTVRQLPRLARRAAIWAPSGSRRRA